MLIKWLSLRGVLWLVHLRRAHFSGNENEKKKKSTRTHSQKPAHCLYQEGKPQLVSNLPLQPVVSLHALYTTGGLGGEAGAHRRPD